jgi:DNA-binding GntR family transcriptional regulator
MAGKGLDLYSDVPLYEQLAAILREMIRSGELSHLDPLPSEARLSQEYDISRDTVRRAIGVLVDEGLLGVALSGTMTVLRPAVRAGARSASSASRWTRRPGSRCRIPPRVATWGPGR